MLLTGYLSEQVEARVQELAALLPRAARIVISREPMRGRHRRRGVPRARTASTNAFLLCNGDSLFDCNLARLLSIGDADAAGLMGCCAGWTTHRAMASSNWMAIG